MDSGVISVIIVINVRKLISVKFDNLVNYSKYIYTSKREHMIIF